MTKVAETDAFTITDRRIKQLLATLRKKGVCGCCTARALSYHGARLSEDMMGSANAAEMLEEIAASLRENNVPVPDHGARH